MGQESRSGDPARTAPLSWGWRAALGLRSVRDSANTVINE